MRIEKIELKNINSLQGAWSIDLTNQEFRSSGVFAITGPTGSGKTTILDAVSLALYGKTPRLGLLTDKGNEVMTKGTGECRCRVTFTANGGRYVADWSQRRARKKADGTLQDCAVRLLKLEGDGANPVTVAEKKTEFDKEVVKIVGMDYERFSRSVILAQGGFSTFLKEDEKKRSETLEKLTGTGIYSEISEQSLDRYVDEKKKYDAITGDLERVKPLDGEERAKLEESAADLKKKADDAQARKAGLEAARNWLAEEKRLKGEAAKALEQRNKTEKEKSDAEGERNALGLASKASPIRTIADNRRRAGKALDDANNEISVKESELPNLEDQVNKTLESKKAAETAASQAKAKKDKLDEISTTVAGLDAELKGKEGDFAKAHKVWSNAGKARDNAASEAGKTRAEKEAKKKEIAAGEKWFSEHEAKEQLYEAVTEISALAASCAGDEKAFLDKKVALEKAGEDFKVRQQDLAKKERRLETEKKSANEAAAAADALAKERDAVLSGRTVPQLSQAITEKDRWIAVLKQVKEAAAALNDAENVKKARCVELEDLLRKEEAAASARDAKKSEVKALKETADAMQRNIELQDINDRLSGLRLSLEDGKPCPLCGAVHHPYAGKEFPRPEKTPDDLKAARAKAQKGEKNLEKLKEEASGISVKAEAKKQVLKDAEEAAAKAREKLEAAEKEAGVAQEDLAAALEKAGKEKAELEGAQEKLEGLEKRIGEAQKLKENAEKKRNEAEADFKAAEALVNDGMKSLEEARMAAEKASVARKESFAKFSAAAAGIAGPDGFPDAAAAKKAAEDLSREAKDYEKRKISQGILAADAAALEKTLAEREAALVKAEEDLRVALEEKEAAKAELEKKREKRRELFGDKDLKEEAERMRTSVAEAERRKEEAVKAHVDAEKARDSAKAVIADLRNRLPGLNEALKKSREALAAAISGAGFTDEEAWKSALIEDADLKRREEALREIDHDAESAVKIYDHAKKELDAHREKPHGDMTLDKVKEEIAGKETEIRELSEELGKINQMIDSDDKTRKERREMEEKLSGEKKNFDAWAKLCNLIGSRDGSKYRNFVQTLTFRQLLREADKRLFAMNPRYNLLPSGKNPLLVDVRDNDRAGEVRPSDNLSGGETFLVSLSLALALSGMAGGRDGIGTLFLDEGFGTLDSRSLNAALGALSGIAGGSRLVGVISHVAEVKERLPVQIAVQPSGSGVSRLAGPGVEEIEEGKF